MNEAVGYVITSGYAGPEQRTAVGDRREGKRREISVHFPTMIWTSLLWLLITAGLVLGYQFLQPLTVDRSMTVGTPHAPNTVAAGDVLTVIHGVTGQCAHVDGGMIIAEAMPATASDWRLIKRITASKLNLEPGKALTGWRIPKHWKPGAYVGQITVWCYGQPAASRGQFHFHVR